MLHFLRSGHTCGEVISEITAGEELVHHFGLGAFACAITAEMRGWIDQTAGEQAEILFGDLVECDKYFADCASNDENDSRSDQANWYHEDTF